VFVLGKDTPGFQEGMGKYMVHFAGNRPMGNRPFSDASEVTFYSGMSNVDFEMQDGNPAAIGIRFHVAQHSSLQHMDFHVGSCRAAMEDIGNQASDIHIYGGTYGIITKRTAPVWQFLLMDSSFEGQSEAAFIRWRRASRSSGSASRTCRSHSRSRRGSGAALWTRFADGGYSLSRVEGWQCAKHTFGSDADEYSVQ